MRYVAFAAIALALVGLAPLAFGANDRGLAQVERAIKAEMNAGPHGRVTRAVRCVKREGEARCVLTSVAGTKLRARVDLEGGAHRVVWEPLEG